MIATKGKKPDDHHIISDLVACSLNMLICTTSNRIVFKNKIAKMQQQQQQPYTRVLFAVLILIACYTSFAQRFVDKAVYTNRDVVVQNKKLYVSGREFIVKGMAYKFVTEF